MASSRPHTSSWTRAISCWTKSLQEPAMLRSDTHSLSSLLVSQALLNASDTSATSRSVRKPVGAGSARGRKADRLNWSILNNLETARREKSRLGQVFVEWQRRRVWFNHRWQGPIYSNETHSTVVLTDSPLRSGMPIVPPVSAKVRLVAPREWSNPRTISAQSLQRNTDRRSTFCQINDKNMLWFQPNRVGSCLTGYGVSIHVIEDVPKTEDPGGGGRWAAFQQRGAEFLPRSAGVKVRVGFHSGTHAARQRAHLIRAAAAFNLASIALHAHFLARKIQRRRRRQERAREATE